MIRIKIAYVDNPGLSKKNLAILARINSIIEEYREEGYTLTLRQLYYQLVSRGEVPNSQREYVKLSNILTKGRLAGIVSWAAIEDRLRVPDSPPSWSGPDKILHAAAEQYRRNRMEGQNPYMEVWVEKDALSNVLRNVTHRYGVPLMVNRGYSSTSAMHDSLQRFEEYWKKGKSVEILYLGDHDPSGLDMIRDIRRRIERFSLAAESPDYFDIAHIGLTIEQIEKYDPPPNPAKVTDPRSTGYIEKYGRVSWEVDALPPNVLIKLVEEAITRRMNMDLYEEVLEEEEKEREKLKEIAEQL